MLLAQSFYERQLEITWWFIIARIGQHLRERYQLSQELPSKLLALLVKLEAIEGRLRYSPPLERRGVDESDWLPPRFVWQIVGDLFGG
jgi:hypothetical protein